MKPLFASLGGLMLGLSLAASGAAAPVRLDFNTYPRGSWERVSSGGSSSVSEGILTIDTPHDYREFFLLHPNDAWH